MLDEPSQTQTVAKKNSEQHPIGPLILEERKLRLWYKITYFLRAWFVYALTIVIIGICVVSSYYISKHTVEDVFSISAKYFQMDKVRLVFSSDNGIQLCWRFLFVHPTVFDAEFEVYTTMSGKFLKTNPSNMVEILNNYNKLEYHPYSPEGRLMYLKEIKKDGSHR